MYKEYYYVRKRRYHFTLFQKISIIILTIAILMSLIAFSYFLIKAIKDNASNSTNSKDYLEIIGYSELTLTKEDPYLHLYNSVNNKYNLKYEILNEDYLVLYASELIKPGEETIINILNKLNEYNILTYKISAYDANDNLISYLNQEQAVYVKNN